MNQKLDVNSLDFDYCKWLETEPNKEEFLLVWNQFTETEKAAILADFYQWLVANN